MPPGLAGACGLAGDWVVGRWLRMAMFERARLSRLMVLLETLPVNSVASIYNRSSVPFDARFRRLLVKQAPA